MHLATEDQATLPGTRCVAPGGWEQGVGGGVSSCLYYPLGFPQDGLGIWLFWRLKILSSCTLLTSVHLSSIAMAIPRHSGALFLSHCPIWWVLEAQRQG